MCQLTSGLKSRENNYQEVIPVGVKVQHKHAQESCQDSLAGFLENMKITYMTQNSTTSRLVHLAFQGDNQQETWP